MNKKEEAHRQSWFIAFTRRQRTKGEDNSFVPRSYPMDSASYRTIRNELSLRIRNGSLFRYLPPQRRLAGNGLGRKLFGGSSLWYRNSWGWRNAARDFLVAFYASRLPTSSSSEAAAVAVAAKGFSLGNFGPLTNLSNVVSFPPWRNDQITSGLSRKSGATAIPARGNRRFLRAFPQRARLYPANR